MKHQGLVHIYTGCGKGKTTCSLGLALRSLGQGKTVCFFQFLKKANRLTGELKIAEKLGKKFKFIQFDEEYPLLKKENIKRKKIEELKKKIRRDFAIAEKAVLKNKFDIIVLDEIINAVSEGFIEEKSVLNLIDTKPFKTELILTGRGASKLLKAHADYVTEMKLLKHPYSNGIFARCGIEY